MRKRIALFIAFFALAIAAPAAAQRLWLKPFYGYLLAPMSDLNNRIEEQIRGWREVLDAPVAFPDKINGSVAYGGEIAYDFSDNYSLSVGLYYFSDESQVRHDIPAAQTLTRFTFERSVQLYDLFFNLRYHFTEVAYSTLNPYLGFGAGLAMAKAQSITRHFVDDFQDNVTFTLADTQGDFDGNTTSGQLFVGVDARFGAFVALWAEGGYQAARVGQMEGTIQRPGSPASAFTSNTSFNYSGFYLRGGLGIALPILK
jgi:outer membrane protein W